MAQPPGTPTKGTLVPIVPRTPGNRLSDMLASFGARKSPSSVSQMDRLAQGRSLRGTSNRPSYAESNDTSSPSSVRTDGSYDDDDDVETPPTPSEIDSDRESSSDDNIVVATPPVKSRILPSRVKRSNISYALGKRSVTIKSSRSRKAKSEILRSDTVRVTKSRSKKTVKAKPKVDTARTQIRQQIQDETKPKRDAFMLAHADKFLPLLPANNYISKMQRDDDGAARKLSTPFQSLQQQPAGVRAVMKPYQLEGLSFLIYMHKNGMSSVLGDEMGLGKTLQTLSLFQYLAESEPIRGKEARPHLIVCPLSVLSSWINECRRWVPELKFVRFHGGLQERIKIKNKLLDKSHAGSVDLIITTYETFVAENGWFKRAFAWRYCVLDEGHKIKNSASEVSHSLQSLQAEHRLLLTGTPLQNNLFEMWSLLHWLYPEVFSQETSTAFKTSFDLTKGSVSTNFMDDSRRLLELIMLRRMKNSPGVNLNLPAKTEILLYVPLTPLQRFWYTRLITKMDNLMFEELFKDAKSKATHTKIEEVKSDQQLALLRKGAEAAETLMQDGAGEAWVETKQLMEQALATERQDATTNDWRKLMNLLVQLRKVCSHPYLVPGAVPDPYYLGDHIIKGSGKFIVLEKLVDELILKRGKKVLIFSGFTRTLNLCEDLLMLKGGNVHQGTFKYARFDGSTSSARRKLIIRAFNAPASEYKVMLISTRAGGLGINLATASDVIFLDEDWNPQQTLQAEARAHRIGQNKPVTVYKLCSQGTVEEQMLGRIRKKLYLSTKITEAMRNMYDTNRPESKKRKRDSTDNNDDGPQLGTSELKSLIRKGVRTLARPQIDVNAMIDWDFDTMIEKCKDKADDVTISNPEGDVAEEDEQQWLKTMEKVETTMFESRKHHRQLDKKVKEEELNRADRRVGKNTTVMVDGFAINKESMNCADWEAVPTMAGKDPRLAEPVREKKAKIETQSFCQNCWDGGELIICTGCPRGYHQDCLTPEFKSKAKGGQFYCSQHQCLECGSKSHQAGGLIFRCRWCPAGYCEECLDWENTHLVGESLPELEMINFGAVNQAYWIECPRCVRTWEENAEDHAFIRNEQARIEEEYAAFVNKG